MLAAALVLLGLNASRLDGRGSGGGGRPVAPVGHQGHRGHHQRAGRGRGRLPEPAGGPAAARWFSALLAGIFFLALVTGLLVGIYVGLVLLATGLTGRTSPVAVAGATLAAAALFGPLRSRVQHRVDRRFNRARYNAERTLAAFAACLTELIAAIRAERDAR